MASWYASARVPDADQVCYTDAAIEDASLNAFCSCLKDLVTLRKPTSPLTFLSYLHSQNRLVAFINRGSTIPTRREFADYLSWAATEVQSRGVQVAFAEEIIGLSKAEEERGTSLIEVTSRCVRTNRIFKRRASALLGALRMLVATDKYSAGQETSYYPQAELPVSHL